MEPIRPGMFITIHYNPILNISTGAMTSGVSDTVSGLVRQVLFLIFAFYFLLHCVE